jgi:hypothetical protein
MKRSIREQIRCGGLSPEGLFCMASRAAGITIAGLLCVSCAETPKPSEPSASAVGQSFTHSTEDAMITVKDDNGVVATIGIRIDGSTQFEATINSADLDRIIIHNPDWKTGPEKKKENQ